MGLADKVRDLIDHVIAENLRPKDVENDTVEFKSWPLTREGHCERSKISNFVKEYSVCFANSDGGLIIFGLNNEAPGKKCLEGCTNTSEVDLKNMIYDNTRPPIMAEVEEVEHMGLRFVAVRIIKSPKKHATSDGRRLHRVGRQCLPMYPDDDIVAEISKGGDLTSKLIPETYYDAVEPSEIGRLRIHARNRGGTVYDKLSDEDFLLALGLGEKGANGLFRPNVAGLVLAGRTAVLEKVLPQAEIGMITLQSDTKPEREEFIRSPLLAALERVISLVEPYNTTVTISTGLFEIKIPRLPEVVLREALLNALSHRDYLSTGSVFVRLYPDRTEIANPGGFLEGITPENILHHEPCPRNRALAEALQKIGLVNRAGLGVDRMYEVLLENGKEPPIYVAKPNSVTLTILHEINESFAKFCKESATTGTTYDLDEILILKYLCRNTEIDSGTAATICQRSVPEAREKLNKMARRNLLDKRGQKKGQHFCLSRKVCDQIGEKVEYTRDRGIDEIRHPEMVKSYLRNHGTIRNKDCQELCGVDRYHAIKLLGRMRKDGEVELMGNRGRGAYYRLSDRGSGEQILNQIVDKDGGKDNEKEQLE